MSGLRGVAGVCRDCGRMMRPAKRRLADCPGTVKHSGHGLCATCYDKRRRPDKPRLSADIPAWQPADWMDRAACRGHNPDLFFPDHDPDTTAQARAICWDCPVRLDCLQVALERREHGIWGGLTDQQRAALRRRAAA